MSSTMRESRAVSCSMISSVGPRIEAFDALVESSACRQHQDRDGCAFGANLPAQVEPVDARKQDVEDQEIVVVDADLLEREATVGRDVHGVRVLAQAFREHGRRDGLVFNHQNPHGDKVLKFEPCIMAALIFRMSVTIVVGT